MTLRLLTGCIAAGGGGAAPSPGCADGSWVTGKDGSGFALDFDGVDDYVTFGAAGSSASNALQPSAGSYALWFKKDDSTWPRVIFGAGPTSGVSTNNTDYGPSIWTNYPSNKMFVLFGNGSKWAYIISSAVVSNATWSHVAITWNATYSSSSDVKLYVNGTETGTAHQSHSDGWTITADSSNRRVALGSAPNPYYYFNGQIQHVGVWNTQISAANVTSLQTQEPSAVASGNLIAHYSMAEGAGNSTLTDRTGNGYSGTLTNMDAGSCE